MTADRRLFFDANAGAPLRPSARAAMVDALAGGNPSSVHGEGRAARGLVEDARCRVAELVGAAPKQVTFTSGGTEANVTALSPKVQIDGKPVEFDWLLVAAVEHPSVLAGGRFPTDRVEKLSVDRHGIVDGSALQRRLEAARAAGHRVMVSVMLANNETGVIQPVSELAAIAHAHGALVHTDAIQAAGRMPVDIADLGVDLLTLSAHKIGGPQGAGALVRASDRLQVPPLLTGGGQEFGTRAGTENVAAIVGFGVAASEAVKDLDRRDAWHGWRDRIAAAIAVPGTVTVVAADAPRLPQTLSVIVDGVAAETLVMALDLAGVAVSAGAACSSGKVSASHVLAAMGVEGAERSAIRISFGWATGADEIEEFIGIWTDIVGRILKRNAQAA